VIRSIPVFRFKNFKVYKDAKDFSGFCRDIIDKQIDDQGLADQIRRALNSIVLNIAEGSADNSDIEFARFLGISIRSACEVVAGFDIALHNNKIDDKLNAKIEDKAEELVKQLSGFRSSLKGKK
jgi:four helix bundle protein